MKCTVDFKFTNGDKVKEEVTGITGIVTGCVNYLTGCNQHLITLKPKDEYSEPVALWYDDSRLTLVEGSKVKLDVDQEKPGADIAAPGGIRGY